MKQHHQQHRSRSPPKGPFKSHTPVSSGQAPGRGKRLVTSISEDLRATTPGVSVSRKGMGLSEATSTLVAHQQQRSASALGGGTTFSSMTPRLIAPPHSILTSVTPSESIYSSTAGGTSRDSPHRGGGDSRAGVDDETAIATASGVGSTTIISASEVTILGAGVERSMSPPSAILHSISRPGLEGGPSKQQTHQVNNTTTNATGQQLSTELRNIQALIADDRTESVPSKMAAPASVKFLPFMAKNVGTMRPAQPITSGFDRLDHAVMSLVHRLPSESGLEEKFDVIAQHLDSYQVDVVPNRVVKQIKIILDATAEQAEQQVEARLSKRGGFKVSDASGRQSVAGYLNPTRAVAACFSLHQLFLILNRTKPLLGPLIDQVEDQILSLIYMEPPSMAELGRTLIDVAVSKNDIKDCLYPFKGRMFHQYCADLIKQLNAVQKFAAQGEMMRANHKSVLNSFQRRQNQRFVSFLFKGWKKVIQDKKNEFAHREQCSKYEDTVSEMQSKIDDLEEKLSKKTEDFDNLTQEYKEVKEDLEIQLKASQYDVMQLTKDNKHLESQRKVVHDDLSAEISKRDEEISSWRTKYAKLIQEVQKVVEVRQNFRLDLRAYVLPPKAKSVDSSEEEKFFGGVKMKTETGADASKSSGSPQSLQIDEAAFNAAMGGGGGSFRTGVSGTAAALLSTSPSGKKTTTSSSNNNNTKTPGLSGFKRPTGGRPGSASDRSEQSASGSRMNHSNTLKPNTKVNQEEGSSIKESSAKESSRVTFNEDYLVDWTKSILFNSRLSPWTTDKECRRRQVDANFRAPALGKMVSMQGGQVCLDHFAAMLHVLFPKEMTYEHCMAKFLDVPAPEKAISLIKWMNSHGLYLPDSLYDEDLVSFGGDGTAAMMQLYTRLYHVCCAPFEQLVNGGTSLLGTFEERIKELQKQHKVWLFHHSVIPEEPTSIFSELNAAPLLESESAFTAIRTVSLLQREVAPAISAAAAADGEKTSPGELSLNVPQQGDASLAPKVRSRTPSPAPESLGGDNKQSPNRGGKSSPSPGTKRLSPPPPKPEPQDIPFHEVTDIEILDMLKKQWKSDLPYAQWGNAAAAFGATSALQALGAKNSRGAERLSQEENSDRGFFMLSFHHVSDVISRPEFDAVSAICSKHYLLLRRVFLSYSRSSALSGASMTISQLHELVRDSRLGQPGSFDGGAVNSVLPPAILTGGPHGGQGTLDVRKFLAALIGIAKLKFKGAGSSDSSGSGGGGGGSVSVTGGGGGAIASKTGGGASSKTGSAPQTMKSIPVSECFRQLVENHIKPYATYVDAPLFQAKTREDKAVSSVLEEHRNDLYKVFRGFCSEASPNRMEHERFVKLLNMVGLLHKEGSSGSGGGGGAAQSQPAYTNASSLSSGAAPPTLDPLEGSALGNAPTTAGSSNGQPTTPGPHKGEQRSSSAAGGQASNQQANSGGGNNNSRPKNGDETYSLNDRFVSLSFNIGKGSSSDNGINFEGFQSALCSCALYSDGTPWNSNSKKVLRFLTECILSPLGTKLKLNFTHAL